MLEWLKGPEQAARAAGEQVRLLKRVFGEHFEVMAGGPRPCSEEKTTVTTAAEVDAVKKDEPSPSEGVLPRAEPPSAQALDGNQGASAQSAAGVRASVEIKTKGKGELSSDRVQNPHDPDATYSAKGQGEKKKEHVGYKIQVAETVSQAELAPGEPTQNFLTGIVTHAAYESDLEGSEKMAVERAEMGLEKPLVEYVDQAYVSGEKLAEAQAEGRVLMGPAQPAPQNKGRYTTADFDIQVEERKAICPAGRTNTQCSRIEDLKSGSVSYCFEWSWECENCPLRSQCVAPDQKHRKIQVGRHHTALQARRKEQKTEAFATAMKNRNGIEGTQSELVRAHGLRRARYRGLPKVRLQNYLAGMACNVKRWLNRKAWELAKAAAGATLAVE